MFWVRLQILKRNSTFEQVTVSKIFFIFHFPMWKELRCLDFYFFCHLIAVTPIYSLIYSMIEVNNDLMKGGTIYITKIIFLYYRPK